MKIKINDIENNKIKDDLLKIFNANNLKDEFIKNNLNISTTKEFKEAISKNLSNTENTKKTNNKKGKKDNKQRKH
ncbi:MAG: hypothetical protein KO202_06115 [Methanobacteriaceae archaeon]|nr:hypothetical protein [Methanobacteriaceae archaeon]